MKTTKLFPVLFLICCLLSSCSESHTINPLPRSTPEQEGVSSKGILDFIAAAERSGQELHSFMLLRHGKVVAEGWWNPYSPDQLHTMYSVSKSFTSTAVGFAVTEGLFSVTDKVVSFFPEFVPADASPYLKEMTVENLLCMATGQSSESVDKIRIRPFNWVKAFLEAPIENQPGTKFLYNSMATYMLSAIVQKVTGEKIFDYLKPRLFDPLSIQGIDWETDLMGINTGGWGLRLKTEDMAKFAQLLLQKGKWEGKQVVPQKWLEEATTFKIDQRPDLSPEEKRGDDWAQGYCYQFWRCSHNAFRGDGAYGQYILVMPDQDAVMAITAKVSDMQKELNLVWDYILPAISDEPLPVNKADQDALKQKLASLKIATP